MVGIRSLRLLAFLKGSLMTLHSLSPAVASASASPAASAAFSPADASGVGSHPVLDTGNPAFVQTALAEGLCPIRVLANSFCERVHCESSGVVSLEYLTSGAPLPELQIYGLDAAMRSRGWFEGRYYGICRSVAGCLITVLQHRLGCAIYIDYGKDRLGRKRIFSDDFLFASCVALAEAPTLGVAIEAVLKKNGMTGGRI